jgi:Glycosyltransferase Family 4
VEEHTPTAPGVPGMRVASIPHADPYVEAVLPDGVTRLGDDAGWLDPAQLAAHADEVDVVHLHVGYGHLSEGELECWTETLRRTGVPLVVTVHQLTDPSPHKRPRYEANLAAVLATAEVVLTLTPGAADEIAERHGRTAIVVAHPSIARPAPGAGGERGVVGLVLGAPSPSGPDPVGLVRAALSGAVSGGGSLRVLAERGALPDGVPEVLRAAGAELVEVPRDGEERVAALQDLHVAVLPERCRTHSRDLEVCRDVGTRVVVPGCGWFVEQWSDVVTYGDEGADGRTDPGGLDPVPLAAAVAAALARPAPRPADRAWREQQLAAVREVHAQVYASVAGDRLRA